MKTIEEYNSFAAELKAVCDKHGIFILGTCNDEGILGEITLEEKPEIEFKPFYNSVFQSWELQ